MKKIFYFLSIVVSMSQSFAGIYAPEGLNMPGGFNGWYMKDGGVFEYINSGTARYHNIFTPFANTGSQGWLFTSGPSSNYYGNKWGGVTVNMNTIQNYTIGGTDNSITIESGKYYTVNWLDAGYTNTKAIWMKTSSMPTTFNSVDLTYNGPNQNAIINIKLNSIKASEENIYVRYAPDNTWSNAKIIMASGTNLDFNATIPASDVSGNITNIYYYVFTSTLDITTVSAASGNNETIDLYSINIANRGGSNYQLPVELTSFVGNCFGNKVNLNWATATEKNNSGFEVQKSRDKENWDKVAFVNGFGISNSPKNYSYTDSKINAGTKYYYRLKQIDNDGTFEYSKIVEVVTGNMVNGFTLDQNYPNPFNPTTTIKFGFENPTKASLKIYDALGNQVVELFNGMTEAGRIYDVQFNGAGLASGVYFYKLTSDVRTDIRKMLLIK